MSLLDSARMYNEGGNDNFGAFGPSLVSESMVALTSYLADSAQAAESLAEVTKIAAKIEEDEANFEANSSNIDGFFAEYDTELDIVMPTETSPGTYKVALPEEEPGCSLTMSVDIETGVCKFENVPVEYAKSESSNIDEYLSMAEYDADLDIVMPTKTSPLTYEVAIPEEEPGCTLTMSVDTEEGKCTFVNEPNEDEYMYEDDYMYYEDDYMNADDY